MRYGYAVLFLLSAVSAGMSTWTAFTATDETLKAAQWAHANTNIILTWLFYWKLS